MSRPTLLLLCLAALSCGAPRAVAAPRAATPSSRDAELRRKSAPTITVGTLNMPFTVHTPAEGGDEGDQLITVPRSQRLSALHLLWSTLVVEVVPTRKDGAACTLQLATEELVPRRARVVAAEAKGSNPTLRLELSPVGSDITMRVRCAPPAANPVARALDFLWGAFGAAGGGAAQVKSAPGSADFDFSVQHLRSSSHPAALGIGVALLLAAPGLATSAAAFYGGAMAAAATTLALLACVALARAAPGGRAKRAVGAASALTAVLLPSMTGLRNKLADSYLRAAIWPLQYTAAALLGTAGGGGDAAEALRPALLAAAVAMCVLSAGAGFFVARRFLIDTATGAVLPGPSIFVLWLLRAAAAAALLHATSDGPASVAAAALAVAATGGAATQARRAAVRLLVSARVAAAAAARTAMLLPCATLGAISAGCRAAAALLARQLRAGAAAHAAAAADADRAAPVPRTPTPPGSSAATPASRATSAGAGGALGSLLRRRGPASAAAGLTLSLSAGPLPASLDPEPEVAPAATDAALRGRRPLLSPAEAQAQARDATAAALRALTSSPRFGAWLVRRAGEGRLSLTPGEGPARAASPEEWDSSEDDDDDDDAAAGDTSVDTRTTGRQRARAQHAPRSQQRSRR